MHDISTALIALNFSLNNQNPYQVFNSYKVQVCNKSSLNTKEGILLELESFKPNFLFLSSSLPGAIELQEVIIRAKKISPNTKIVLAINESDGSKILNYLTSNVDSMVWAENFYEHIESLVKQLKRGQLYLCGKTAYELRQKLQTHKVEASITTGLLELLTTRELEVLNSLTQGSNYKEISKILFISESTVKTHINNIFTKLNVGDRTQAVLYALRHGIENLVKKPNLLKDISNEPVQK